MEEFEIEKNIINNKILLLENNLFEIKKLLEEKLIEIDVLIKEKN